MKNDAFMDKCRQLTSSIEVDNERSLEAIKTKLLAETEEGNIDMIKNKKVRRLAVAAAILAAVLSISAVVYAAVPIIWRNIDVVVSDGEQYIESLIAKTSEDGSHVIVGAYFTENSGRVVIDTEDGVRTIFNDGLQPYDLDEALSILQMNKIALPVYLPNGFAITAFAYPFIQNFDPYNVLTMNHMSIMYSNEYDDVITLMIHSYEEDFELSASEENTLLKIEVNGVNAFVGENKLVLFDANNGILYRFSSSPNVDNSILIKMAESMK